MPPITHKTHYQFIMILSPADYHFECLHFLLPKNFIAVDIGLKHLSS